MNEPLWEASLRHLPERDWPHIEPIEEIVRYVGPALRWAREEAPEADLLINDYGLSQSPEDGPPVTDDGMEVTPGMQRQRYLELARALVKVKPGYARNYLLPQGMAAFATPHNLRIVEMKDLLDDSEPQSIFPSTLRNLAHIPITWKETNLRKRLISCTRITSRIT